MLRSPKRWNGDSDNCRVCNRPKHPNDLAFSGPCCSPKCQEIWLELQRRFVPLGKADG